MYQGPKPNLPKNYAEKYDPTDYEWRSTLDLESYARNLKNYLATLLQDDPFPAALFEKMEERLSGIRSILAKRCQEKNGSGLEALRRQKKEWLEKLDSESVTSASPSDSSEQGPPKKRARSETIDLYKDVRNELNLMRKLKNPSFEFNDKEEKHD